MTRAQRLLLMAGAVAMLVALVVATTDPRKVVRTASESALLQIRRG